MTNENTENDQTTSGKASLSAPAGSEYVPMWNNKGEVIQIPASATIEDLLKMGVKDIRFGKPGEPLEDEWWASSKYEGCGQPSDGEDEHGVSLCNQCADSIPPNVKRRREGRKLM